MEILKKNYKWKRIFFVEFCKDDRCGVFVPTFEDKEEIFVLGVFSSQLIVRKAFYSVI